MKQRLRAIIVSMLSAKGTSKCPFSRLATYSLMTEMFEGIISGVGIFIMVIISISMISSIFIMIIIVSITIIIIIISIMFCSKELVSES